MKLHIDKEADALYLRLDDSPFVESIESGRIISARKATSREGRAYEKGR